ncbi:MAG: TIM barrel protein, partial [Verrucomicrobiota bacterium]
MTTPTRRRFLRTAAVAPLLPALTQAASPSERFPIGLSLYSLRDLLQVRGGDLDPLDYASFAKDTFDISYIDYWEGGLPKDKLNDQAYFEQLRTAAEDIGTDIFLHMSGALMADPKKAEASIAKISESIPRAKWLGATYMRVFLKAPGEDAAAAVAPCVEALKPICDSSAEAGIIVAIEPGASPLSQQGAFLAQVYQTLNHEACTLMPDFGKLKNNIYDGTAAMLPFTKT